jgi:four helix bundle protein
MSLTSYRDLKVWQLAMDLEEACYRLTRTLSRQERFGMCAQIQSASAAVPANIAEGYGRGHWAEYVQFLHISQGSLKELETHLLLCARVELTTHETIAPLLHKSEETGRALGSLIRSLRR